MSAQLARMGRITFALDSSLQQCRDFASRSSSNAGLVVQRICIGRWHCSAKFASVSFVLNCTCTSFQQLDTLHVQVHALMH